MKYVSAEAKNFYSAGSSFSFLWCACVVEFSWLVLERVWDGFSHRFVGLLLSAAIVYAYAWAVPEPSGYPKEGRRVITRAEYIFGFFNTFIVLGIVLGLRAL